MLVVVLLVAGCSGEGYDPPVPTVSNAEISAVQDAADDYESLRYDAWPDIRQATELWADDIVSNDPLNSEWVFEGTEILVPLYVDGMAAAFPDIDWVVGETYLATDSFVYRVASDLWPPWVEEPDDAPPTLELDWWRFEGDEITSMSFWFADETAAAIGAGCFKGETCNPDPNTIVSSYIDAWASGDTEAIAALYATDAVLVDTMLGIDATGPDDISQQATARFGTGPYTIDTSAVYVQTDGFYFGQIFGVAILYTIVDPDGTDILSSVTLFELGTLQPGGDAGSATLHPQGLITREEVLHLGDDLIALEP